MTLVDRRTKPAGFMRRQLLFITGRLRRSSDKKDGVDVDQRLDFVDVRQPQIGQPATPEELAEATARPFSSLPLPTGDARFIERPSARAALEHGFSAWKEGRPTLMALVGPRGCGLTTLLNQVPAWAPPEASISLISLAMRPATTGDALALAATAFGSAIPYDSVDAAAEAINQLPARMILVDNGHFLYSRLMGGGEGIRALQALMVATQGRHLWLLACETQAWRRQCDTSQTDRYFGEVVELSYFEREDFAAFLAARNAGLGEPGIDALLKVSRGHPGLALLIVAGVRGGQMQAIPAPFDESPLRSLARTELLALAEMSAHGALTATELQSIFRRDAQSTSILLHHLRQSGLIVTEPQAGEEHGNRLQPLLAPEINAYLVRANYLY